MLLSGSAELIGGAANRSPLTFGAEHVLQLGGESPLDNPLEVKS